MNTLNKNALNNKEQTIIFNEVTSAIDGFESMVSDRKIDVILFIKKRIAAYSATRWAFEGFDSNTTIAIANQAIENNNTISLQLI